VEQLLDADLTAAGGSNGVSFLRAPREWLLKQKLSRGFWVFFTVAFFFDFGFAVYFFLFNLYLLDLHFNERVIGLVGGALTLGSMIGTLPAGWLARRTGVRPLLAVLLSTAPLVGVARALVLSEWAQISLAFLAGLSMCFWGVCFLPALARLTTEENRASAFSLIFSVSIGTSALGSVICGYLPHWLKLAGFALQPAEVKRMILIVSCAIVTMGLISLLRLRVPREESEPRAEDRVEKKRRRMSPFLMRFLPSMALWTAVLAAFSPFASVYMSKDLHISMAQIGLVFSASQVVQLSMGLLTPIVFRRLGLVNGIVATQVATAVAIGCLAGTQSRGLAIALFLSFSATQWMSTPGLYNLLMSKVTDEERSSAAAMTLFCNAVLQSGATAGAGILFALFGYPRVLTGIAALALTAAFLFRALVAPFNGRAPVCQ
jgi:predicted MFS family arabinose efflux permease